MPEKMATPATAIGAISPPPTLWATFHMAVLFPLSLTLNQWTRTRPDGGHPMPWNQPFKNSMINIMAIDEVKKGTNPIKRLMTAERIKPAGRNILGLLRSDIVAITNLLSP